jgi:hypothetical protein
MVSVYDGQTCLGFVLSRGSSGFEGFTYDRHHPWRGEVSVGLYKTATEAANVITTAAKGAE